MNHSSLFKSILRCFAVGYFLAASIPSGGIAGDWPQILGPDRSGSASDERPIRPWGDTALSPVWKVELGQGYAGPAVANGRVIGFHRVGDTELVAAWDVVTGKRIWSAEFPASYQGGYNEDLGPRCVPLVHGEHVYVFGAAGDLHCVSLADGSKCWSRDTYGDYRGKEGYFGAGSTPIVGDGKLLVNVGGRNAGIVAFDLESGETVWQKTTELASYSSPTLTTLGGRPAAIFVTRLNALAIDPHDGNVLFSFGFGASGATVNAATPLVFDNKLFVSSSYGVGAKLALCTPTNAKIQWSSDEVMSSQYTTCVYRDGYLYGTHGREDFKTGELRCLDAETGRLYWQAPGVGVAHLILVNDQLLILDTKGKLLLARASSDRYQLLAEAQLTTKLTRALPAFSDGRFFFRDTGSLYCFALAP